MGASARSDRQSARAKRSLDLIGRSPPRSAQSTLRLPRVFVSASADSTLRLLPHPHPPQGRLEPGLAAKRIVHRQQREAEPEIVLLHRFVEPVERRLDLSEG